MAKTNHLGADQLDLDVGAFAYDPPQVGLEGPGAPPISDELQSLSDLVKPSTVLRRLQKMDWAFTDAVTSYYSHGLHPYPAKFIPQLPRQLIANLTTRGELVWDPFGGSGTTALEAVLLGRRALSTDLNPVAKVIGEGKTAVIDACANDELGKLLDRLAVIVRSPDNVTDALRRHGNEIEANTPEIPNREKWFHVNATRELAYLRWEVARLANPSARALALATFSRIVLRASFQDAETRYASKPRDVVVGMVLRLYFKELSTARAKAVGFAPLIACGQATFETLDLRHEPPLAGGSIDAVVTSPPYPNATDYHLYHRFRLFWLGFSPVEVARSEIGSHLRHQKEGSDINHYLREMGDSLGHVLEALRPGRFAALVIGDAVFEGKVFSTALLLADVAAALGFEVIGHIDRPVHETKRSFAIAARRLRSERVLILRRPPSVLHFTISAPPYKLWAYEEVLRAKEIGRIVGQRVKTGQGKPVEVDLHWWQVDTLRRLTFSRAFSAAQYEEERTWQSVLENGDAAVLSKRKDPKYATHGLHAYKGKFYPQLAKALFNLADLQPGDTVFDPYCGSGTVLLEAKLNGLRGIGTDLNPLAIKIARAKTAVVGLDPIMTSRELDRVLAELLRLRPRASYHSQFADGTIAELEAWFPKPVLGKLASLLSLISDMPEPALRELAEVCLSNIVREISQQDPKDLRIRRRKESLADAPVFELFAARLSDQRNRLLHFAEQSARAPHKLGYTSAYLADSRDNRALRSCKIMPNIVDSVVTSPPYATALPYIDTDRLSLLLLMGMSGRERSSIELSLTGSREISTKNRRHFETMISSGDFEGIPSKTAKDIVSNVYERNSAASVGFRRQNQASVLYRYYRDLASTLRNLNDSVKPSGSLFFVIGNSLTVAGGTEVVIKTAQVIREIGGSLGWELIESIPITVTQDARPHHRNSITENEIIWLRKP